MITFGASSQNQHVGASFSSPFIASLATRRCGDLQTKTKLDCHALLAVGLAMTGVGVL